MESMEAEGWRVYVLCTAIHPTLGMESNRNTTLPGTIVLCTVRQHLPVQRMHMEQAYNRTANYPTGSTSTLVLVSPSSRVYSALLGVHYSVWNRLYSSTQYSDTVVTMYHSKLQWKRTKQPPNMGCPHIHPIELTACPKLSRHLIVTEESGPMEGIGPVP